MAVALFLGMIFSKQVYFLPCSHPIGTACRFSLDMNMAAIPVFAQDQATVVKEVQASFSAMFL